MYTIGQMAEMFGLPISTLRYYDKQGLFPNMERASGIRKFSDTEIEALRVIECLKKAGMEIGTFGSSWTGALRAHPPIPSARPCLRSGNPTWKRRSHTWTGHWIC